MVQRLHWGRRRRAGRRTAREDGQHRPRGEPTFSLLWEQLGGSLDRTGHIVSAASSPSPGRDAQGGVERVSPLEN